MQVRRTASTRRCAGWCRPGSRRPSWACRPATPSRSGSDKRTPGPSSNPTIRPEMAGHSHSHAVVGAKLRTAFVLTIFILVVELAGGIASNSLALLSDAGHVVTDLVALGLAWFATSQADRPANALKTYGYHRVGIL